MKLQICILAALLGQASAGYTQVLPVKPGLWEHDLVLKSDSGRLELALELARAHMALLPPAQRQVLDNLLTRPGVKFDLKNQRFLNCISEEEAATGRFRFAEEGGCEVTRVLNRGPATLVSFVCAQARGELVLKNASEYTGESSMTLDFNGFIEHATATHSGRWLGTSCAALEP